MKWLWPFETYAAVIVKGSTGKAQFRVSLANIALGVIMST